MLSYQPNAPSTDVIHVLCEAQTNVISILGGVMRVDAVCGLPPHGPDVHHEYAPPGTTAHIIWPVATSSED